MHGFLLQLIKYVVREVLQEILLDNNLKNKVAFFLYFKDIVTTHLL